LTFTSFLNTLVKANITAIIEILVCILEKSWRYKS